MALPQPEQSSDHSEYHLEETGVRVRFGVGVLKETAAEIDRLGCQRALILSTPQQSDTALSLAEEIGGHSAGVFTRATMHTPTNVSEEAVVHAKAVEADCVVSIGGGSTIGLGKAIALRTDLPQIVIPTTYAGSEATPILGQTEDGVKTTLVDDKVLPEVILYDASLVRTLPVEMTVTSALNAMAHAAEALYAQNRTPESTAKAKDGLQAFVQGLPVVLKDPSDLNARQQTLFGAWLCGTVLGRVGMALDHKLCHTLGGSLNLPHADTHAIILPHAMAFNERTAARELAPIAEMLKASSAGQGLYHFARRLNAPLALRDLGVTDASLDHVSELAVKNPYWNPQPVTQEDVRAMLQAAWAGDPPIHV